MRTEIRVQSNGKVETLIAEKNMTELLKQAEDKSFMTFQKNNSVYYINLKLCTIVRLREIEDDKK